VITINYYGDFYVTIEDTLYPLRKVDAQNNKDDCKYVIKRRSFKMPDSHPWSYKSVTSFYGQN
jgi:hypothetical protein